MLEGKLGKIAVKEIIMLLFTVFFKKEVKWFEPDNIKL